MSGSPPRFHCTFPCTLSPSTSLRTGLSKGAKTFLSNLLKVEDHGCFPAASGSPGIKPTPENVLLQVAYMQVSR